MLRGGCSSRSSPTPRRSFPASTRGRRWEYTPRRGCPHLPPATVGLGTDTRRLFPVLWGPEKQKANRSRPPGVRVTVDLVIHKATATPSPLSASLGSAPTHHIPATLHTHQDSAPVPAGSGGSNGMERPSCCSFLATHLGPGASVGPGHLGCLAASLGSTHEMPAVSAAIAQCPLGAKIILS